MSGWKTMPLGDFAESVDYGVTASATAQPLGPKFLRITDIQDGAVNWESVPWCECDMRSASDARLKTGDIVFARTGATTGKSFLIRECPTDAVFASYLIRVRVGEAADPRFVSHFFQTPIYWAQITKSARGVAQPGVNATTLKALEIPLPPLAEQRRIAEVLDRAEALRAKRRFALAQLDSLTQSLFLDLFGDPVSNPKRWPRYRLGEVAQKITDGEHLNPEFSASGMPIVMAGNVLDDRIDFDNAKSVEWDLGKRFRKKCDPEPGDLLLVSRGATIGRQCVVGSARDFCLMGSVILIKPSKERVDSRFLSTFLRHPVSQSALYRTSGSSAQQAIYLKDLQNLNCVLPPIDLQQEFALRVRAVEKLKTAQRASLAELDALFATLQHRAFRGEL